MDLLHWSLIASAVLAAIMVLFLILSRSQSEDISYQVKKEFISQHQRKLWVSLQKAVGDDYMVLARVPLAAMIEIEGSDCEKIRGWLERNWADYGIFENKTLRPRAVVQFENREQGQGKTPHLETILSQARLALLWLPSEHYQRVELLRHALTQAMAKARESAPLNG